MQVWASKWNDRAWLSRRAQGVPEADLYMAVLLQQVPVPGWGGVWGRALCLWVVTWGWEGGAVSLRIPSILFCPLLPSRGRTKGLHMRRLQPTIASSCWMLPGPLAGGAG